MSKNTYLGIVSKFRFYKENLSELINFCSPWNHEKTYGLMISGEIGFN